MSQRDFFDLFRCCCCFRRGNGGDDEEGDPQTYETLNEFIFEAEDEERAGFVAMNDIPTETSVQAVFPDPATSNPSSEESNGRGGPKNNNGENNVNDPSSPATNQLNEPLL